MATLIARNTRLEVGTTLGTPVTVTAVTKATEGVVTAAAHGFANGDAVVFTATGMVELDGQIGRVASTATNTFNIENFDTTLAGTFTAGTVTKVTAWATFAKAQSVEAGSTTADRRDATVLLDSAKQYVYGASDSPEITVNGLSDLNSASVKLVANAAKTNASLNFRLTFNGQAESRLFRGTTTRPGESITVDQLVTSSFSISQQGERMAYAS
jgi:hypothetical protein